MTEQTKFVSWTGYAYCTTIISSSRVTCRMFDPTRIIMISMGVGER